MALHPGVELSYPELVTLLAKITYTVNSRPLGLANIPPSSQQEGHMMPLTPNMLLLARSSNVCPHLVYSGEAGLFGPGGEGVVVPLDLAGPLHTLRLQEVENKAEEY